MNGHVSTKKILCIIEIDSRNEAITQMLHASNALGFVYSKGKNKVERKGLSTSIKHCPSSLETTVYRDFAGLSRFGDETA